MRSGESDDSAVRHEASEIFVSYARSDVEPLDDLLIYLSPSIERFDLNVWHDRRIEPGTEWRAVLEERLQSCRACILLVTGRFLASKFISQVELPILLEAARTRGLKLFWVAVGHANFDHSALAQLEAVNDPNFPVQSLHGDERAAAWVAIAKKIELALSLRRADPWTQRKASPDSIPAAPPAQQPSPRHTSASATNGSIAIGENHNSGHQSITLTNGKDR